MKKLLLTVAVLFIVASSMCVQQKEEEHQLTCDANWSCTEWSDCLNSEQTRECTDMSECGKAEGKPDESRVCVVETNVVSLQFYLMTAKDFDRDNNVDGFYFNLAPKTEGGSLVKQDGSVDIAMWYRAYDDEFNVVKGDLIGIWNDTAIHEDDYGYTGVPVAISYTDFTPDPKDYAIIEVTLTTPQGAKVTAVKENFLIGRQIYY